MKIQNWTSKKGIYILTLITMLILMGIFLNSFYWPHQEITKRKILVGAIVLFCVTVVPILTVKLSVLFNFVVKIIESFRNVAKRVKDNKKKVLCFVIAFIGSVILSGIAVYVMCGFFLKTQFNIRLFYTFVATMFLIVSVILLWNDAGRKVERVFVMVALIMGVFSICVTPNRVGIAPDDEIHLARTLEISDFLNGITHGADAKNIRDYANNIYSHAGFDRSTDISYKAELNSVYKAREWQGYGTSGWQIYTIAYIPAALGIILGRGLGMPYVSVFNMGRLFNLLTYILLISLAIRRVKHGKVLVAAVGLIPTTIFLATSYSCDPWITGFTILGLAYFFAELQDDELLQTKNIIIMAGALAVGSLPKAVYFAILFPLLFMPKRKFKNSRQRMFYYLVVIGAAILLMASFLMPMLISGPGVGDVRGGADVNSTEQVKFILENPITYAKILLNFLVGYYLELGNLSVTMQTFAYVGDGFFGGVVISILIVIAFLDRGINEKNQIWAKGATLLGSGAAIVLATTALYVGFTAVASGTVAGMQGRYLIPVIYPILYAVGIGGTTHRINRNIFVCIPILLIALTFIFNMGWLCAFYY